MKDLPRETTCSQAPPPAQCAVVDPETTAPSRVGWSPRLAWLPIPLLLVTMAVLWAADPQGSYESAYLLMALNLVCSTLASGLVAYLIGRSFLIRGTPGLLMLGCGVLAWGSAGLVGVATGLIGLTAGHFDINVFVTIHNVCVWLSALCHLAGALLSLRPRRAVREASLWLAGAYSVALGCAGFVTLAALAGWTPTFFVQGQGGTPLRYLVLGSATAMFAVTAVLLKTVGRRPLSAFLYWYTLALGLIAVGLFGIMIEPVHAGPLSWTGRAAQFLGGAYMLIAAIASVRESRVWGIPLEEALQRERTFVSAVLETVGALVTVLDRDGRIVSFNRACEEASGYSFAEVKGRCFWDFLLVSDEVEPVKAVFARLQAGQFPNEHENYWVAKDGTRRLIHWTNSCLTDSSAAVEYVIGTGIDVTEQRRAQKEREVAIESLRKAHAELETRVGQRTAELNQAMQTVEAEQQRFQVVLDQLPAYVILLSPDYHVPFANQFFEDRFGKSEGRRCYEYLFHRTEPCENCETYKVLKTGAPHRWEWTGPDGRNYDIYDFPFTDTDGSRLIMEVGLDITERKQAEEAVRAERQRFLDVLETLPVIIVLLRPDHRVEWVNRAYRAALGDNVGRLCFASQFGHDQPCQECQAFTPLKTGRPYHWEWALPNGRTFDIYNFPFADADGSPLILEMDIDITERRQAEAALKELNVTLEQRVAERTAALAESEVELRTTLESIGDGFFACDADWRFVYVNAQAERILGIRREAVLGKSHWEMFPLTLGTPLEHEYRRAAAGEVRDCENFYAPWGRWFHNRCFPRDGGGMSVFFEDITERKQVEDRLQEIQQQNDFLAGLVRDSSQPVAVGYSDGRLGLVNRAFEELTGYTADELRSLDWATVLTPPEWREMERDKLVELRRTRHAVRYEKEYIRKDGTRVPIELLVHLATDSEGAPQHYYSFLTDITERKRAEESLMASLAEKEVLLKEIHHRVKNNMQVISSLVALQADRLQDASMREVLQDVTHRVRSMALVHEKLYQSPDMARVEFAAYAQSLLNYLWRAHGTAASGVRLVTDLEPVPLSVNAAVPCGLILNELVSNALKHAFRGRAGGEVAVSLHGNSEGHVCLRVRDNGTGLPPGLDWRQADSLGLHLVQILAGQLRATVEVSRSEGTEFTVTLQGPKI